MPQEVTQVRLKELLHYEPATGVFRWISTRTGTARAGSVAGSNHSDGYKHIKLCGKMILAHRLAWFYMTGKWPSDQIDHIDGNRANNAWENIREATAKQNQENLCLYKTNTSGYRGVGFCRHYKKWYARVRHNGKRIHIGYFYSAEEAAAAAKAKRAELFTHDTGRADINL